MTTTVTPDSTNQMATFASSRCHQFVFNLVRRRTPEEALLVLEDYILALANERPNAQWRKITGCQYSYDPDLLEYYKIGLQECAQKETQVESNQLIYKAKRIIKLIQRLYDLQAEKEEMTYSKLAYEATTCLNLAPTSKVAAEVLLDLVGMTREPVAKGVFRALRLMSTPKAIYYMGVLNAHKAYCHYLTAAHTNLWYAITGREHTDDQVLWASVIGEVQKFEEFVRSLDFNERNVPVDKPQILAACLGHVKKMCEFAKAVQTLKKTILESGVPIDQDKGKKIQLTCDVEECKVTEITIPLYTWAPDFYVGGTHTRKLIEEQKVIVAGYRIKLKDDIFRAWTAEHGIPLPVPHFVGELQAPEVAPAAPPKPEPVPVE